MDSLRELQPFPKIGQRGVEEGAVGIAGICPLTVLEVKLVEVHPLD